MKRLVVLFSAVLVGFAPGIAHGATALVVGGAGPYAKLSDEQIRTALGGHFDNHNPRVSVEFPGWASFAQSIQVGADNLVAEMVKYPGPKTIGGVSKSGPVIDEVLRRMMADPNKPPAPELKAVIYGYPNRTVFAQNGVEYRPLPETPYDVLIVKAEYDGLADWPDNTLNFLAVINALAGSTQFHVEAAFYDIDLVPREAPYYIQTRNSLGGTVTSIMIPTPILPLLRPLAPNGVETPFVKLLDSVLRPIIDSAYNRPTAPAPAARTAVTSKRESDLVRPAVAVSRVGQSIADQPTGEPTTVADEDEVLDSRKADVTPVAVRAARTTDPQSLQRRVPSRAVDAGESSPRRADSRAKSGSSAAHTR